MIYQGLLRSEARIAEQRKRWKDTPYTARYEHNQYLRMMRTERKLARIRPMDD